MSVKALQDYTFVSKYARYNKEKKRRETWLEAVERVKEMHLRKYPQISEDIEWAFKQVKAKRVLGSQRALQFGGDPILKKHARIYNCIASYCDRVRFFQECFWLLLCGCGTGFSVQKHHIDKLPEFSSKWQEHTNRPKKVFVVDDSIEGWADALGVLLNSYLQGDEWEGYNVIFDYSLIRPEGSPLASSAGKAPGPLPLRRALEEVRKLLNRCVENGQTRLRPIDAYDIVMHASDAVLSGGVRRSATICLFSADDMEMARAKTGNWRHDNPQRGRSNNSALLIRGQTTKEQFSELMGFVKEFGEPGFVWADSTELLVNPCVEIGMFAVDMETGLSGWQACNLCEINGRYCKTPEDFEIACRAAAIIGTCQAGYTNLEYLGIISKKILEKEALLGVSITGMMDNPDILFDPALQRKMGRLILDVNEEIANKIGVNPCARATCVKPAGTTSCILGTASGIHAHHASRYIRRSQANWMEPPLRHFKKFNPLAVEKSVWSANGTDEVVAFCIEVPKGAKTKNDINAVTLLEHVKSTQRNWVASGVRKERCTADWLTHNVSNTITVREDEWDEVTDFIYNNRRYFAGISLLPITGDKDYPQAPFTAIYTPRELVDMYGDAQPLASGLIVDALHAFDNNLWKACDAVLGLGEPLEKPMSLEQAVDVLEEHYKDDQEKISGLKLVKPSIIRMSDTTAYLEQMKVYESKQDWIRRANQFAKRYFDGDVKLMTYCLKDVNNWKYWCDLRREYVDVDYTTMVEEDDCTKLQQTSACAGGACDLQYA